MLTFNFKEDLIDFFVIEIYLNGAISDIDGMLSDSLSVSICEGIAAAEA